MSHQDVIPIDTGWMASDLIMTYLLPHDEGFALIETGPQKTAAALLDQIRHVIGDAGALTDIVVTHIHLDHSGAAGWLQQQTGARIHVHQKGARQLVDPARIIAGSRQVFGAAFDQLWQEPVAASGEVLALHDGETIDLPGRTLQVLDTPGHAWHHAAFLDTGSRTAFTGDVAGVRFGSPNSVRLPTVPADFNEQAWRSSLQRLLAHEIEGIALTHGGLYHDANTHIQAALDFLDLTMDCFSGDADEKHFQSVVKQTWDARLREAPEDAGYANKYELIMATPLCVKGILLSR